MAQDAARATATDTEDEETVVVTAQRQRGAVIGDIKPELQLGPADIRSLGVTSISDLLAELGPELRSLRGGPPVVLLEGRRISSFAEIRDIPAEAIVRIDILPEEVALKYGYSVDQKVMNIVLRPRFRAWTGEARAGEATEGGAANAQATGTFLRIQRDGRLNVSLQASHRDSLLESQRHVVAVPSSVPFDSVGNIAGVAAGQPIDPGLSALAGVPVFTAGVPAIAPSRPLVLADLLATANQLNVTDTTSSRTLLPQSDSGSANLVWKTTTAGGAALTLNGRIQRDEQRADNGLAGVTITLPPGGAFSPFAVPVRIYRYDSGFGPLGQSTDTTQTHAGLTLDGVPGAWRWNVVANLDRSDTLVTTRTGVDATAFQAAVDAGANPFAPLGTLVIARPADTARSLAQSASAEALLVGSPFRAPAGDATLSMKAQASLSEFESRSIRGGAAQRATLSRNVIAGQANLDVPLASRDAGSTTALGDLGLNANLNVQDLSDFGMLKTLGYGLTWSPLARLSFIVSHAAAQSAPSMQQLQGPVTITPNVALIDPLGGATSLVTRISGGSPALVQSRREALTIGANWTPLTSPRLQLSANYLRTRIDDPVAAFPSTSAVIAAAFPDHFVRDASGALTQFDARPVNFSRSATDALRWGFNLSIPLASQRNNPFAALARGRAGAAGSGGRGAGFGGRIQLALYHTITLRDELLVRPGVPIIDLLRGGATGSMGGTPRHQFELQAGATRSGLGARLTASWQTATDVRPGLLNPGGELHFSAFGTANLRLFANLGGIPGLVQHHPWLRGSRVTLSFDNLFDERQRVTAGDGTTPLPYQAAYLDPTGRTVMLGFRKLFFSVPQRTRDAGRPAG